MPLPAFTFADAMVRVSASTEGLAQGLLRAQTEAKRRVDGITNILGGIGTKMLLVGGVVGGALLGMVNRFASAGDAIYEMSQRTGFGTERLSELKYALEQTGGSFEGLEVGVRKMQRAITDAGEETMKTGGHVTDHSGRIQDLAAKLAIAKQKYTEMTASGDASGSSMMSIKDTMRKLNEEIIGLTQEQGRSSQATGTYTEALGVLGLKYQDLANLKPQDQFNAILEKIAAIQDPTQRAALAMQFFGKSGTDMIPMMEGGREGMELLRQEAHDTGKVFSEEAAEKAAVFQDKLEKLTNRIEGIVFTIGEQLLPKVEKFVEWADKAAKQGQEWIKANEGIIETIGKAVVAIVGAGGFAVGLNLAVKTVANLAGIVGFLASPAAGTLALALAGIIGAITLVGLAYAVFSDNHKFKNWVIDHGIHIEGLVKKYEGWLAILDRISNWFNGPGAQLGPGVERWRDSAGRLPGDTGYTPPSQPAGASMLAPAASLAGAGGGGTNNYNSGGNHTFHFSVSGVNDPEQFARDLGRIMRRRKL